MVDSGFLTAVSEVSAAFAGFAGLVTVIAQRMDSRASEVPVRILRNMLLVALLTTLGGLLPHVPISLGISESIAWQIASGIFFVCWVAYIVLVVPESQRFHRGRPKSERRIWYFHLVLHSVAGGALLATILGVKPGSGLYELALFIMLYIVAYLLLRVFLSIARS